MEIISSYCDLEKVIESIRNMNLLYIAKRFIDKSFWLKSLETLFQGCHIENQTSFDYSRCFTYVINISDSEADLLSGSFDDYIKKNGAFYRLVIKISILGPFCWFSFVKYTIKHDEFCQSAFPFLKNHFIYIEKVNDFCKINNLRMIDESLLGKTIPDITLELCEGEAKIYDIFFDE